MYCSKCGTRCPEDAVFCHRCGYKLYIEPTGDSLPQEEPPVVELPQEDACLDYPEEAPLEEQLPEEASLGQEDGVFVIELSEESQAVESESQVPSSKGRRSLKMALLILAAMMVVGTLCYALLPDPFGQEVIVDTQMRWFSINRDGVLTFLPEQYSGGSEIIVPASINGIPVIALADGCFANDDRIVTVELPDGVTTIGSDAFAGCASLRGLYLPDSLLEIHARAFSGCNALEALSIPESVEYIAPDAMDNCSKLLYIFYGGTSQEWASLYHSYITPYTQVICSDGAIFQPTA